MKKPYKTCLGMLLLFGVLCLGFADAFAQNIKIIPVTPAGLMSRPVAIVSDDDLSVESLTCPGLPLPGGGELCTANITDTVYVADLGSASIKQIVASVDFTVAKRPTSTLVRNAAIKALTINTVAILPSGSAPFGMVLHKSGGAKYLYVSDAIRHVIWRINLSPVGAQVQIVAGADSVSGDANGEALLARLNVPAGMTIKSLPTSYLRSKGCSLSSLAAEVPTMVIAEAYGRRIRAFTFTDGVPSVCTLDSNQYNEPVWVASGGRGLFTLDNQAGKVELMTTTGRQVILTELGEFSLGLATDRYDSVYVANNDQNFTSHLLRLRWDSAQQTYIREELAASSQVCDPFTSVCSYPEEPVPEGTYRFPFSTVSGICLVKGLSPYDYIGRMFFGDIATNRVYLLFDPDSAEGGGTIPPPILLPSIPPLF